MTKQSQQLVLLFFIGVLVGVSVTKIVLGGGDSVSPDAQSGAEKDALVTAVDSKDTLSRPKDFPMPPTVPNNTRVNLSVLDQKAGQTVQVTSVSVSATSWIAIYEEMGGKPGSILGAVRVVEGDRFAVVPLLRPEGLTANRTYFAVVLPDNGDGQFDHKSDTPPLSPDNVVMVKFRAL